MSALVQVQRKLSALEEKRKALHVSELSIFQRVLFRVNTQKNSVISEWPNFSAYSP